MTNPAGGKPAKTVIHIDKKKYDAPKERMTGAELRELPEPDIGADRDLWQVRPGDEDNLIDGTEAIDLKDGMHFFTAPSTINPG